MYGLTKAVPATEFTRLPEKFRKPGRTSWGDANAVGQMLDSFLEGPSTDHANDRESQSHILDRLGDAVDPAAVDSAVAL